MKEFFSLVIVNFSGLKRDKALWSLFAAAFFVVVLVPVISFFSLRQVKELTITLSLASTNLFLLIWTIFFGATGLWRDLEKRFAVSALALPITRRNFIFAKFFSLGIFLFVSLIFLMIFSALGVLWVGVQYPSERVLIWSNFIVSFGVLIVKYSLLLAIALVFSAVSTSFFLPIFGTICIYLAGSASHQVVEFLQLNPEEFSTHFILIVRVLHNFLPNFSAFDFQVYAVYGLDLPWIDIGAALVYGLAYTSLALLVASVLFNRREI